MFRILLPDDAFGTSDEVAIRRALDAMATPSERKGWLIGLYGAGGLDDDQIAFWFMSTGWGRPRP